MEKDYARVHSSGMDYHFYIHGGIEESHEYLDLLYTLQTSTREDKIHIHINSGGGYLDTAVEIINAIRNSQSQVIAHAEALVASAATLIFFSADALIVHPFCQFMIHDGSSGEFGKVNENLKSATSGSERIKLIAHDIYKHYLTEEEIDNVLAGMDLYLLAEDVQERCERAADLNKEELDKLMLESEEDCNEG